MATEEDIEKMYQEYRSKLDLPGFRKGRVPGFVAIPMFKKYIDNCYNHTQKMAKDKIKKQQVPVNSGQSLTFKTGGDFDED